MKGKRGVSYKLIKSKAIPTSRSRHKIDDDVQDDEKRKEQKKYGM